MWNNLECSWLRPTECLLNLRRRATIFSIMKKISPLRNSLSNKKTSIRGKNTPKQVSRNSFALDGIGHYLFTERTIHEKLFSTKKSCVKLETAFSACRGYFWVQTQKGVPYVSTARPPPPHPQHLPFRTKWPTSPFHFSSNHLTPPIFCSWYLIYRVPPLKAHRRSNESLVFPYI